MAERTDVEMRCEEAESRLLELIEEALPPGRRAEVLSHLQVCSTCSTEFTAYRDLIALVRADPVPEPSPRFWENFLPSLRHRIEQEASRRKQVPTALLAALRSWFVLRRPFIAGLAVAAISILIVIRLPGFLPAGPDRNDARLSPERSAGLDGESRDVGGVAPQTDGGKRSSGDPLVVAGEVVEDPTALAAAIQHLPWVDEITERVETAWVFRPESDPGDWVASLTEEERQILLDRLRSFRWSQS
jgi:hypothetical protein